MNSLFIIFFISLRLSIQVFGQRRSYIHVPISMTWYNALQYCREHHTDLAVFGNQTEYEALQDPCGPDKYCWIGLHRDSDNSSIWRWSNGEDISFTRWNQSQPDHKIEKCGLIKGKLWFDFICLWYCEVLCSEDELILVKENKTWEEALVHCRSLKTEPTFNNMASNHLYDLSHMHAENDNSYAKKMIQTSQTQEVWIGLRFLAGHWLWVDDFPLEEELKQQLPVCPAPTKYCGTMSKTGGQISTRDCAERRNFFCLLKDNLF